MRPATTEISKTPAYGAFIRKKMMPSRRLATASAIADLSRSLSRMARTEKRTNPTSRMIW